jgi:molybdopterin biosynthesis enzyme
MSSAATSIRDAMGAITSLTSLDDALKRLLEGLEAVPVCEQPIDEVLGRISAGLTASGELPVDTVAMIDGWAARSLDIVGASSYSPAFLIECGQSLPAGYDCVIEPQSVHHENGIFQVVAEARPGQGVRRTGDEIAAGASVIRCGQMIRPLDILIATQLGLRSLSVRVPRLRLVNVVSRSGQASTAQYIAELAKQAGATVTRVDSTSHRGSEITALLDASDADLVVTIGGTGEGKTDETIDALRSAGVTVAHGIAVLPGRTAAVGRRGPVPIIALPGMLEDALAVWWTLVLPVLDRLTMRQRPTVARPIARKIASAPGIADIVLLAGEDEAWLPLSVGELPLQALARADAWMLVAGNSEGFPAGALCPAYPLG